MKNKVDKHSAAAVIRKSAANWTAPYVPRTQIGIFTGGLYSTGYFANLDTQNKGVPGSFSIGRQRVYPVESLVEWLIEKIEG